MALLRRPDGRWGRRRTQAITANAALKLARGLSDTRRVIRVENDHAMGDSG